MRWVRLSGLLLLMMLVGWADAVSGKRVSGDAAVGRLGGRRSGAGELSSPNAKEAVGKLPRKMLLQFGGELLSGFFKLRAEGLENLQLGIAILYVFLRKIIGRFNDRD
ncbi:hypothetical protein DER46DRAFT_514356 [Fusarium sp. MPI-SDFR-AT-0072]|nr:hypothetical protein DER46DRAFT_514356 [Fusarium sp. MPI-SDFR-AT-0072]